MTPAVMIILAAAVAAWVLAPLRGSAGPGPEALGDAVDPQEGPPRADCAALPAAGPREDGHHSVNRPGTEG